MGEVNGTEQVAANVFVSGCVRLKGAPRFLDLHCFNMIQMHDLRGIKGLSIDHRKEMTAIREQSHEILLMHEEMHKLVKASKTQCHASLEDLKPCQNLRL